MFWFYIKRYFKLNADAIILCSAVRGAADQRAALRVGRVRGAEDGRQDQHRAAAAAPHRRGHQDRVHRQDQAARHI